jgi:prolyl 4-hydroxylase
MNFSSLPADLQRWLNESLDRGCSREALVQSMLGSGYAQDFALGAVAAALQQRPLSGGGAGQGAAQPAEPDVAGAGAASSTQLLAGQPNFIEVGDRRIQILSVLNAPRIILFGNVLSDDECDALIGMSKGKLERSNVVNKETGRYDVHPDRTSEGTYFRRAENELIVRIEARIAELTSCPLENGEPIQVLHYRPGAEYKPHYDYFNPADTGNRQVLSMGGQRIATLIMYLNDVESGGSTVFPQIGLDVLPRRGNAVFFAYGDEQGNLDTRTLHGGSAVSAGEKWIATKWFRQRAYAAPSGQQAEGGDT